jgi:hypothetical protein
LTRDVFCFLFWLTETFHKNAHTSLIISMGMSVRTYVLINYFAYFLRLFFLSFIYLSIYFFIPFSAVLYTYISKVNNFSAVNCIRYMPTCRNSIQSQAALGKQVEPFTLDLFTRTVSELKCDYLPVEEKLMLPFS